MKGITETIQRIRSIKIKMTRNSSDSKRNVPKINAPKIKGRIGHEIECEKKETAVKDARKQKNAEAVKKTHRNPLLFDILEEQDSTPKKLPEKHEPREPVSGKNKKN